jgi:hypothetical protein
MTRCCEDDLCNGEEIDEVIAAEPSTTRTPTKVLTNQKYESFTAQSEVIADSDANNGEDDKDSHVLTIKTSTPKIDNSSAQSIKATSLFSFSLSILLFINYLF